jgi:SAM-dependent methyltransferase
MLCQPLLSMHGGTLRNIALQGRLRHRSWLSCLILDPSPPNLLRDASSERVIACCITCKTREPASASNTGRHTDRSRRLITSLLVQFADHAWTLLFDTNGHLQAFHWFSNDESLKEIHRVLRPVGVLAMVWNAEDCT